MSLHSEMTIANEQTRTTACAPVLLFVYNRLPHTRRTLDALRSNGLAAVSDLIIHSDGPKQVEHEAAVREVREYIRTIDGFNSVTLIERPENYGLARSIISGATAVIEKFGRVIVLEDDLVTSRHFLAFMNDALDFYHDDDRVVSVHGYMFPVAGTLPETFFIKDTGSWGWATWKRGWELFESDGSKLLNELRQRKLTRAFDMDGTYPFTELLEGQVDGRYDSWAIRWQASAFLKGKLTLFPGKSLVANIGLDNSGVHCVSIDSFDCILSDEPIRVGTLPVEENIYVLGLLKDYFRKVIPGPSLRACMKFKRKVWSILRIAG